MTTGKRIAFSILAIVISVALGLVALEALVRLTALAPPIAPEYAYVPDPHLGYKPKPFLKVSGRSASDEFDYEYAHNSFGFRDVEHALEKDADTFRILGLGDSFTYGIGARFEETYLYRLEEMLNRRRNGRAKVEIIKAGISRYYPELERKLLEHYGIDYAPDLVLVGFVPNDVIDTYKGAEAVAVDKYGFLRTHESQDLGTTGVSLYRNSHLARLVLRSYFDHLGGDKERPRWDEVFQDDGFHEDDWRAIETEFEAMLGITREMGARLAVVHIPQNGPWDDRARYPAERLSRWASSNGADFIDVLPAMSSAAPGAKLYYEKDGHCTPAGYQVIASRIFDYLTENRLVPD